jgi:hypothetical protein
MKISNIENKSLAQRIISELNELKMLEKKEQVIRRTN